MKSDVIAAWEMVSDHRATRYETILRESGEIECSCPGWIFRRKNQPRNCKHVDRIRSEAAAIMAGRGVAPPTIDAPEVTQTVAPKKSGRKPAAKMESPLQAVRRRMICLDDDVAQA